MVTRTDYRLARAPIERLYRQYDTDKHFQIRFVAVSPGDHRDVEPPDPIPNSAVKRVIADGSVGSPHVRVGHRQALITRNPGLVEAGVFALGRINVRQKKGPGALPAAGPATVDEFYAISSISRSLSVR